MQNFRKGLGERGEWLAAEEYRKLGYKLLDQNVNIQGYKQLGEIDLIVRKGKELVFVEVKTRTGREFMDPIESVTWRKQNKVRKAVRAYIENHREYDGFNFRIDAAIVEAALDGRFNKVYIIEDVIQDLA